MPFPAVSGLEVPDDAIPGLLAQGDACLEGPALYGAVAIMGPL